MRNSEPGAPRVERARIPAEYGVSGASEFVDWSHIAERFTAERVYWVATLRDDGSPHLRPIDGLFVDNVVYVGGSPKTRWVGHISRDPRVTVHLDGAHDDVVIWEGIAEVLRSVDGALALQLADASNSKFPEYNVTPDVYVARGAIAVRPRRVIAWTDITRNPTRFVFDD